MKRLPHKVRGWRCPFQAEASRRGLVKREEAPSTSCGISLKKFPRKLDVQDFVTSYVFFEIHVKASDWYKHKHHFNQSYDTVILHVVYEADVEVYTTKNVFATKNSVFDFLKPVLN